MRPKLTTLLITGALAAGGAGGYAVAAAADDPVAPKPQPMSAGMSDMSMMDAEHRKMLREPAIRAMHRKMVREHEKMLRDPEVRRRYESAMAKFPDMARMMRDHMGS